MAGITKSGNVMSVTFSMTEVRRFETDLRALGDAIVPVARKALHAGSAVIVKAAKAAVPVKTGRLRSSIGHVVRVYQSYGSGVTVVAVIGSTKSAGQLYPPYAHLVEFGTKPHMIPKGKTKEGKVVRWWKHPGSVAKSYLHRSFHSAKASALDVIEKTLSDGVKDLMRT